MEAKYVIAVIIGCMALGMVAGLLFYAAFKDPNAVTFAPASGSHTAWRSSCCHYSGGAMDRIKYFIGVCRTGRRYDDDADDESGPLEVVARLSAERSYGERRTFTRRFPVTAKLAREEGIMASVYGDFVPFAYEIPALSPRIAAFIAELTEAGYVVVRFAITLKSQDEEDEHETG